jgi:hypothetical protein
VALYGCCPGYVLGLFGSARLLASLIVPHVDLGTVPSWLGAGSLLLAFVIFFRDRGNSDRTQVDRLGTWFTEKYERRVPGLSKDQGRVEEAAIEVHVRNASDLPLHVVQLAYEVRTAWMILSSQLGRCLSTCELPGMALCSSSSMTFVSRQVRRSTCRSRSTSRTWPPRKRYSFGWKGE